MINEPHFILLEDALYFHDEEIKQSGGTSEIRDIKALEAALDAPKASFGGKFLMDLFDMAASYVEAVCTHHPFLDGNKRTGAVCALTFLFLNGFEVDEKYDEELSDQVLSLVTHKISKSDLSEYFRDRSKQIE